jgi:ATP-dependent helicase/nuclease subunit B
MSAKPPEPKTVFNIPAGIPFARALAAHLLEQTQGNPQSLAAYRIFLPTRRACQVVREAFLQQSDAPLLLPRLQPLGDVDGEELALSLGSEALRAEILAMPPGIPPLRRQILLALLIAARPGYQQGFDQALLLAAQLGRLLDQVIIENISLDNLDHLVPEALSEHWGKTLDFLSILREHWPGILEKEGCIEAADRRNRLIRALADNWNNTPPDGPVLAAGSTGSMPATAELLNVIAGLPNGAVVLPGLDTAIDEASWTGLNESHPQHGLQQLLHKMKITRDQVKEWPLQHNVAPGTSHITQARRTLASEIMRPAATVQSWQDLATSSVMRETFVTALERLDVITCENDREEADVIAGILRQTLETPGQTAALVTPDRTLARRVTMACRRWGVQIDDSAGLSLAETPLGIFLRLIIRTAHENFAPVSVLALLKHTLSSFGMERSDYQQAVMALEMIVLRSPSPLGLGLDIMGNAIMSLPDTQSVKIAPLWRVIAPILGQIRNVSSADQNSIKIHNFNDLIKIHLEAAEAIACSTQPGADYLWTGEAGQAAAVFWAELQEQAANIPDTTLNDYEKIIAALMSAVVVRPAWGTHPRLAILGQLEARLSGTDVVIMGGLNEGVWPGLPGHDPWMSRPMRQTFGLPARERDIGLAAHDFVQGFCRPGVIITRSIKSKGTPTVSSRWLQRLETVIAAAHVPRLSNSPMQQWMRQIHAEHGEPRPAQRPKPRPPVEARPRRLAATRIETWQKDPYGIYARYILRLRRLEPLNKQPDAAMRGNLLHEILQQFVQHHPGAIPAHAAQTLIEIAQAELEKLPQNPAAWSFWWPRFARIADWIVQYETDWRRLATPVLREIKGSIMLQGPAGSFTLEAIPDRIDRMNNSAQKELAILDYKSGGTYSKSGMKNGKHPQLGLEAMIAAKGGFPDLPAAPIALLSYWVLKGGEPPGQIISVDTDIDSILETTEAGLLALIHAFDDPRTPYYSLPRPDNRPRFNDYEHLARIREWTALGENEVEAA